MYHNIWCRSCSRAEVLGHTLRPAHLLWHRRWAAVWPIRWPELSRWWTTPSGSSPGGPCFSTGVQPDRTPPAPVTPAGPKFYNSSASSAPEGFCHKTQAGPAEPLPDTWAPAAVKREVEAQQFLNYRNTRESNVTIRSAPWININLENTDHVKTSCNTI